MADPFWSEYWARKKQQNKDTSKVTVKWVAGRLQVACPRNENFIRGARQLAGRWRAKSHVWSFKRDQWEAVKALIRVSFDITDTSLERLDERV